MEKGKFTNEDLKKISEKLKGPDKKKIQIPSLFDYQKGKKWDFSEVKFDDVKAFEEYESPVNKIMNDVACYLGQQRDKIVIDALKFHGFSWTDFELLRNRFKIFVDEFHSWEHYVVTDDEGYHNLILTVRTHPNLEFPKQLDERYIMKSFFNFKTYSKGEVRTLGDIIEMINSVRFEN